MGELNLPDVLYYRRAGLSLLRGEPVRIENTYVYVVEFFYRLFGPRELFPVFLNILLGASFPLFAYLLARRLGAGPRAALLGSLVLFLPSSLAYTSLLLKDALVASLFLLAFSACLVWPRLAFLGPALAWVGLAFLPGLRPYLVFPLAGALSLAGILAPRRREMAGLLGAALVGLYFAWAVASGVLQAARLVTDGPAGVSGTVYGVVYEVERVRRDLYGGGDSSFGRGLSPWEAVFWAVFSYLLAPFPWMWPRVPGWRGVLLGLEMVAWYGFLALALLGMARWVRGRKGAGEAGEGGGKGGEPAAGSGGAGRGAEEAGEGNEMAGSWREERRPIFWATVAAILLTGVVVGTFASNAGALQRLRLPVLPLVGALAAVGASGFRSRRRLLQ